MSGDRFDELYGDGAATAERDWVHASSDLWCEENVQVDEEWTQQERAFYVAGHLEGWRRCGERLDGMTAAERRDSLAHRCARDRRELADIADALLGVGAADYARMCALAAEGLAAEVGDR